MSTNELLKLRIQTSLILKKLDKMETQLEEILPYVRENTWWIDKVKKGFVAVAITGVVLGIVACAL